MSTAQNADAVRCSTCGTSATGSGKFCRKCGAALNSLSPAPDRLAAAPERVVATPSPSKPAVRSPTSVAGSGLSMWWVIGPTLLFAFLSRSVVEIAIVAILGAGLWIGKTKDMPPTVDARVRAWQPYVPAVQILVVFVMLGGSLIVVAMITAAVIAAARYHRQIVAALEPWWLIQSTIPPVLRRPLAIVAAAIVGYYFGKSAGGREWTYTLISNALGMTVAFLITFTPPDSVRVAKRT